MEAQTRLRRCPLWLFFFCAKSEKSWIFMLLTLPDDVLDHVVQRAEVWLALRACSREGRRVAARTLPDAAAYAGAMRMQIRSVRYLNRVRFRNLRNHGAACCATTGYSAAFTPPSDQYESWHRGPGCMAFTLQHTRCTRRADRPPYLCTQHMSRVPFLTETLKAHSLVLGESLVADAIAA